MAILFQCECGRRLSARDDFAGRMAVCPSCGRTVETPNASAGLPWSATAPPMEIREFLEPPQSRPESDQSIAGATAAPKPALRRMFEALLDPRAIQWMLLIGGGLCVLGIVVWLVSKGIFENKLVLAAALGACTLSILGAGWYTALRTRFRVAGQALTFLGCVIAPLNLWLYHAQDLLTVDGHLWAGGVVCCLIYAATVWVLRDPLFIYACQAGVTLTALLLLADLGKITDMAWLSLFLMTLGLASVHAERAFSPAENSEFPRRRYGLPMFWSGHAQIGAALSLLLGSQLLGWLQEPAAALLQFNWSGNLLTQHHMLAAGVWLAAVYAYIYSDVVVRRIGVYLALAGFSLVMAETTLLLGFDISPEWIIAAMALTSVGINIAQAQWGEQYKQFGRFVPPLGWVLGTVPVLWGVVLHLRATSGAVRELSWSYETNATFAVMMMITALANRASAWLTRRSDPRSSSAYFVLSALALVLAAAGVLRQLGLAAWSEQAPWLMLIPIGYLAASRLWRGHTAERPLYWVAQGAAGVILAHVLGAALEDLHTLVPTEGSRETLLLALVFAEAIAFYVLGAVLHRRSVNVHLAAAAASGALWQLMGYWGVDPAYYTMLYAALGLGALALGRVMGVEQVAVYRSGESQATAMRGPGLPSFQTGTGILCVALLAAFMQGLAGMATPAGGWTGVIALAAVIAAALAAAVLAPAANWRRFYLVAATALGAVTFLRLNMLIELSGWQKLEIFCVAVGLATLAGSHVAAFREQQDARQEGVSFGLGLGSALAVAPLVIAVLYYRWSDAAPSLYDEIALLSVTVAMTVTGAAWQFKATTLWGGSALVLYLAVLICSLAYHPQVAIGVYLAVGGALLFVLGVALSIYREKLLELPERAANREGLFRILNWR